MKVSDIKLENIKDYLKIEDDFDDKLLEILLISAKDYVLNYTGLTIEQIDNKESITVAILSLIADLYENREYTIEKGKVNKITESILNMYCNNLV